MSNGTCSVDGCSGPSRKRGWCAAHYQQQRRTGRPPEPFKYKWAAEKRCLVCGATEWVGKGRKVCSRRCQQLFQRWGEHRPTHVQCSMCSTTIDLRLPGRARSGGESSRLRRSDTSLCDDCRRQRKYRHHFSTTALGNRDGWICRICGGSVDPTARWPNPLAASVDHVIARADGGSDDPSNLQLAHMRCNAIKSRRSGWTFESG